MDAVFSAHPLQTVRQAVKPLQSLGNSRRRHAELGRGGRRRRVAEIMFACKVRWQRHKTFCCPRRDNRVILRMTPSSRRFLL